MAVYLFNQVLFLCMLYNVISTKKTTTEITFGVTVGEHDKSNSYHDLTLTLYWNSTMYQCTLKPKELSRTYECDISEFWMTIECMNNSSHSTDNIMKLTLEHTSPDTVDIDSIYVIIDEKSFEIDHFFTNLTWENAEHLRYKSNISNEWYDVIGLGSDYFEVISIIMYISNDNESYIMFEDTPTLCSTGALDYTIKHEEEMTFTEAQKQCQLASIRNVNDLGEIIAQRDKINEGEEHPLWIGLINSEAKWKWLDGTKCDNIKHPELCLDNLWESGQPENNTKEYCAAIHKHDLIHSFPCNSSLWFVCNKQSELTPKNPTQPLLSMEAILIICFGTAILCIIIVISYIYHRHQSQTLYHNASVSYTNDHDNSTNPPQYQHSHISNTPQLTPQIVLQVPIY